MKTFSVSCDLDIEADSEEEAYDKFLDYLAECVRYGDVTVFDFKERNEAIPPMSGNNKEQSNG